MKKLFATILMFLVVYWIIDRLIRVRMTANLVEVPTKLSSFYVKDLPNQDAAADLLEATRINMMKVITKLKEMPDSDIPPPLVGGIRRLVRKHCYHLDLAELDADKHNQVAMNQMKGKNIYLCLRECPDCLGLTNQNRLLIVALHELSHSATKNYDPLVKGVTNHGKEFKLYEGFVISVAEQLGLLDASAVIGTDYCGVIIPPVEKNFE